MEDNEALVEDYWIQGRGCEWARVGDKLSHSNLMKLASIDLNMTGTDEDQFG